MASLRATTLHRLGPTRHLVSSPPTCEDPRAAIPSTSQQPTTEGTACPRLPRGRASALLHSDGGIGLGHDATGTLGAADPEWGRTRSPPESRSCRFRYASAGSDHLRPLLATGPRWPSRNPRLPIPTPSSADLDPRGIHPYDGR